MNLPHPSQHPGLRKEQAGEAHPRGVCGIGGKSRLHPGRGQHRGDHGATGMAPLDLRAPWLCTLPDQGNRPCFAEKSPISQPLPKSWTPSSSLLWLILHTPATAIFPLSPLITSFIMPGLLGLAPPLSGLISCPPSPAPITNTKLVLQFQGTMCPLGPQHCPSAHNVLPYSQGLDSYVTFSCNTFLSPPIGPNLWIPGPHQDVILPLFVII